jgi:FimV-like protein
MPMRQWILILTFLVATQAVAAPDAVLVGRYLTVEPAPTAEQLHPLKVVIDVRFPRSVHTVGGAVQHLLPPSGYQLADTRNTDRHASILMSRPLPEVHRRIGPATLQDALAALAGEGWQLEVDPVHRLVSFRLHGPWRERYAAATPAVWPFAHEPLPEPPSAPAPAGWIDATAPEGVADDRYGPVRHGETLLDIALRYWSGHDSSSRGMVALLRTNPDAFLRIDGVANMNLLRAEVHLRIPAEREVLAIAWDDAEHTIAQQHAEWQRLVAARAEAKGAEEARDE